jgi:hypothetical protein
MRLPPGVRLLAVKHHAQSTAVWCWAATIAMVAEFLNKTPVSDCDVASRLDRAYGGDGRCCDSDGVPDDRRCVHGRRKQEMTEVMNWYFHLTATEIHHALEWDELKASIDTGFPLIAELYFGGEWAHAVTIVGYKLPDIVIVDDPAFENGLRMGHYGKMASGGSRFWVSTWYFKRDEVAGQLSSGPPPDVSEPLAKKTGKPPASTVTATLPALGKDAAVQKFVHHRMAGLIDTARECYDTSLEKPGAPPSPATMRLSFGVEHGTPMWIMTKDAGGLPADVTNCVADSVSRWTGLFPTKGAYERSQVMDLTFERLAPAPGSEPTPLVAHATPDSPTSHRTPAVSGH